MKKILFSDCRSILDMTYGNGNFWNTTKPLAQGVIGLDINESRAKTVCGDFTALPFRSNSIDLLIFDPPYLTDTGIDSQMANRYSSYTDIADLINHLHNGCDEIKRVATKGCIIKVQDYIHASKVQWLPLWIIDFMGQYPYDWVIQARDSKMIGSNWNKQLSVYRNHAIYLAFRFDSMTHKRRTQVSRSV